MKVLITGAAGFIGSHLTRRLLERGDEVRGLLMPGEDDRGLEALGMEVRRGDLSDPGGIKGIAGGCDKVIHTAMRVLDWGRKKDFFAVGVEGTRHLLEECADEVKRFLYMSSIAAYGFGPHLRDYDEYVPLAKTGMHYGDAKIEAEQLAASYAAKSDMETTIIRPANVTGPGSVWVREILDMMSRGPMPLIDGGCWNASMVFVDNLVDGIVMALDSDAAAGRIYNLRDDYDFTWRDYVEWLGSLIGKKPMGSLPYHIALKLGWIMQTLFLPLGVRPPISATAAAILGRDNDVSNRRAKRELGWSTRVTWEEARIVIEAWVRDNYR